MKTLQSAFISSLLVLLVLMFASFGAVAAKALPIKFFAIATGLHFLIVFIGATWPARQPADRLVKVLNLVASALCMGAMLLVVQHYFNTVPLH